MKSLSGALDEVAYFLSSNSKKQLFSILSVVILTFAVGLTVNFAQQHQTTQQHASTQNYYCSGPGNPKNTTPNNGFNPSEPYSNNHFCATDAYCDSNQNGATSPPCIKIANCTCGSNYGKLGGEFTCNSGEVKRSCGGNLYCIDGANQSGIWPCSSAQPSPYPPGCGALPVHVCILSSQSCKDYGNYVAEPGYTCGYPNEICCGPASSGGTDYCSYANTGPGGYCGSELGHGAATDTLYTCSGSGGTTQSTQDCTKTSQTCIANPTGSSYCGSSNGGPGGGGSGGSGGDQAYYECETDPNHGACGYLYTNHGGPESDWVTYTSGTWHCQDLQSICSGGISGKVVDNKGNAVAGVVVVAPAAQKYSALQKGTTKSDGTYTIGYANPNLIGGNFTLQITPPANYTVKTTPSPFSLTDSHRSQTNANFVLIASSPTPSATPPPNGPTPTPTQTPSSTKLTIALQLPGIGKKGNLSPKHTKRPVHISIYASNVDPTQPNIKPIFDSKTFFVRYNNANGYFTNTSVNVGSLPTGEYQLLVKVPGYLRKQYMDSSTDTKTIHLTQGQINLIPVMQLIVGDVTPLYNVMDLSDFYAIVGCYENKATSSSCSAGSQITDLNDDGVVNGIDLNYWLIGYQTLLNNNDTSGNGDGTTGD